MEYDIASFHVNSFNYLLDEGINLAISDIPAEKLRLANGDAVEIRYCGATVGYPTLKDDLIVPCNDDLKLFPAECRQRELTYKAPIELPIMLKSNRCHLNGLSREQLIKHGEEGNEKGGYFICKGTEKVIRLLVASRRNYPIALIRRNFRDKGDLFTQYGVLMKCIRQNHSATIMTLHYLENGTITIAIQFRNELFYLPLMYIIKALVMQSDQSIYQHFIRGRAKDLFWAGCVSSMLLCCQEDGIRDQESALIALGSRFRVTLEDRIGSWETDQQVMKCLSTFVADMSAKATFCDGTVNASGI
ncbi:unnamed protein product [Dracunculus medinensis]|uniref:DNA-directed RNA polymerase n=1 Tax=Dracunculus medinensis TaxID=318479 RepID=A0A0N4U8T8_DRAME|nr:unnamed protein product [Dracunculus medinensis]